jgi:hypothetical protein
MVELFNLWYLFFIALLAGSIVGLYYLLRHRSDKTKRLVLGALLIFNLALHFLKMFFPPYSTDPAFAMRELWFVNVCGTSVLFFPFIFVSKSDTAKDYMVFLGLISGFLAALYPTEALGKSVLTLDLWRFYICHGIIFMVPLLMVLLKLHKLDVKRIWKMPICVMAMLLFIICNQVLQSELGIIPLRNGDMLDINFRNPSLIWGPTDGVAVIFSWLTPDFMKTVPFGQFAGQEKYWPFFWMLPGVVFYFTIVPLLICFILDFKGTVQSFKNMVAYIKHLLKLQVKKKEDES